MIELAERPAETKPPRVPAGWYDPDSSAFEPAAAAAMTHEVDPGLEPGGTGYRDSGGVALDAPAGSPDGRTTSNV